MDLSKLPRLSKSETPPPPASQTDLASAPNPAGAAGASKASGVCGYCAAPLRAGAKFCDNCGTPIRVLRTGGPAAGAGGAAEAWISIGIGILLLFIYPWLVKYVSSKVFHTTFAPYADLDEKPSDTVHYFKTDDAGNKILTGTRTYLKTNGDNDPNFPNDLAITSFALALILEGIALVLSRRPIVVTFALVVTVAATLYNLIYFLSTYAHYKSIAPISALAVIFGGYMAVYQFGLFQSARRESRR